MEGRHIKSKILMVFIALVHFIPFYILISLSIKKATDYTSIWSWPKYLYFNNYSYALIQGNLLNCLKNNIIIVGCAVVLLNVIGSICAYPLARFKTGLNKVLYSLVLALQIVPALAILVPLYEIVAENLHATSTYWIMIALFVTFNMPLCVFLYTGFIGTIPKELDEAALIDGVSRFGIVFRIIMPLLTSVTATVTIIAGVFMWNDYQFSLFFLQRSNMYMLTIDISNFFQSYFNETTLVAAACLLAALPLVLLFLFMQRFFIKGLTAGSLKL